VNLVGEVGEMGCGGIKNLGKGGPFPRRCVSTKVCGLLLLFCALLVAILLCGLYHYGAKFVLHLGARSSTDMFVFIYCEGNSVFISRCAVSSQVAYAVRVG